MSRAHQREPLRGYQQWLADEAACGDDNAIVVLPTGAGKTRVAFELVHTALERHPGKTAVFLCPTVVLAEQQHDYFVRHTKEQGASHAYTVALSCGSRAPRFNDVDVVFATPAKYVAYLKAKQKSQALGIDVLVPASTDAINTASQRLRKVSLIVIDEVHHAVHKESAGTGSNTHYCLRHTCTADGCVDATRAELESFCGGSTCVREAGAPRTPPTSDTCDFVCGVPSVPCPRPRLQSNHAYSQLLALYNDSEDAASRPKVVGLTASVGESRKDIAALATCMVCCAPSNLQAIAIFKNRIVSTLVVPLCAVVW